LRLSLRVCTCTYPLVPPTKIISLIFHPPFSPSASSATFLRLRTSNVILSHCSRFPPLPVISSLIRRTLEFQHIKDLVVPIDYNRIESGLRRPNMTSLYGSVPLRSTSWSFSSPSSSCPSFAEFWRSLLMIPSNLQP